jgi:hypothetical protein
MLMLTIIFTASGAVMASWDRPDKIRTVGDLNFAAFGDGFDREDGTKQCARIGMRLATAKEAAYLSTLWGAKVVSERAFIGLSLIGKGKDYKKKTFCNYDGTVDTFYYNSKDYYCDSVCVRHNFGFEVDRLTVDSKYCQDNYHYLAFIAFQGGHERGQDRFGGPFVAVPPLQYHLCVSSKK